MTCTIGSSYKIKPGDTLADIAKRELGNSDRWREIKKADGTLFTEKEAQNLWVGQEICLPRKGSVTSPSGNDFGSIVSRKTYEAMFPNRNPLYSYNSLVTATQKFPLFCKEGSSEQRKREASAFLANIAHETTGGWDSAPGGRFAWGLRFIEEQNRPSQYCDRNNSRYPCVPGKSYHGRGPIQLSWNYNYGQIGQVLGVNLLANPDLVTSNGVIAFQTALWFWMTPQPPKPSCHAVMTGGWKPSANDLSMGRIPGFGMTINIINGGLECSIATNDKVRDRVGFYQRFCQMLGVNMGDVVYCDRMAHY